MISIAALMVFTSCGPKKEASVNPADWASNLLKDNGIEVPFHPSTDFVELMRQYKANPELWDSAFECLSKTAPVLSGVTEFGTTELVGKKCYAVFSEYIPKPFEETKLEGHHDYIDIQLTEGPVKWGVCPSDSPKLKVLSEYDPSIEAGFYLSDDTVYYTQEADQPFIFVFFPKNLHNPSFAADGAVYDRPLKKLVIKVANAE